MSEFNYTDAELKALKQEYAKQASQQQFDLWIAECRNRGLVPVKDVVLQVRATKEWNPETKAKEFVKKAVHITTIQALRKLAERTGKYAGQLPSIWIYLDNEGNRVESDIPLPERAGSKNPRIPWAAKASVLRKGFEHPIIVPARFEAYAQYYSSDGSQSLNSTWANRGPEQLEKCAEALALRKAFPEELGGLYLLEEFTDEETVAATAQPSTENVQTGTNVPNLPQTPVQGYTLAVPNPPVEVPTSGKIAKPVNRKKKESVPDAGKPWGGEFEPKTATTPGSPVSSNAITPDNPITDADVPFPGDPEPKPVDKRPATDDERKDIMDRLIVLKDKGFSGIREYLMKETGVARTNDIPYVQFIELVDRLEKAESAGTLKDLLK